jgi:hypothetical protein
MTTPPDIDTDFAQFTDAAEFHDRRHGDKKVLDECLQPDCPNIFILERRVDRHREELNKHMTHIEELKTLVKGVSVQGEKNSQDTSEILEIVKMGKSFFRVADWVGTKVVGLATLVGMIVAAIIWLRPAGKP